MARWWTVGAAALLGLTFALGTAVSARMSADMLTVDRVVVMMRHGIRPPTKNPAMPARYAADAWPGWSVNPGWLTQHGAQAVATIGAADRAFYMRAGLFARGCPDAAIIADSDQRTIATAQAYAGTLAPGCPVPVDHRPQGTDDPRFSAIEQGLGTVDVPAANAAMAKAIGPGGIAAVEARMRPLLSKLDTILCAQKPTCGVGAEKSAIAPAQSNKRPDLTGALDRASTAAQILLLEYADGKPMREVGWGRATAADVTALSEFHALEFAILARPKPIAAANLVGLVPAILRAMAGEGPRLAMISGHDTNVANLGGMLGLHWHVPGFAADDPAPGGAIILERLTDAGGNAYVRAYYRAQTLDQLRAGAAPGYRQVLPITGCRARGIAGLCTLAQFQTVMSEK
ncbi:histidine-type phosphatase [Sphingomonas sp.]|uniref:histidine-type phosphatase n=1 Tax=Sphingomonas sp. TaxID=28214 RepID=UPI0025E03362|nr:histidine-type phosphatase [Sphingomonas sp.]